MIQIIRLWLLQMLGGVDAVLAEQQKRDACDEAVMRVQHLVKTHWRVLPLPFSEEQLQGRSYGEFITPRGFAADAFGECSVPAMGPHGYEQRAGYVSKDSLFKSDNPTLTVMAPKLFDKPHDSEMLVPVIVTVLR